MSEAQDIIYHEREGVPNHHFYVLVYHTVTGKCFLLKRNYTFISNGTQNDHIFAQENCVQTWMGWKPTGQTQLPKWAIDLPAIEFVAYWMWNK